MICPNCNKKPAIIHPQFGATECKSCQLKVHLKPTPYPEITTQDIKNQRREYNKDIIQPYRDGVLSKEYLEEYGTSGVTATKEEIKAAKYVWQDTKGWWDRSSSKGGRSEKWKKKNVSKELRKK